YGIGTDYFSYEKIYYQLTTGNDFLGAFKNSRFEPGWIILNQFVKFLFDDVRYLFLITSLMIWVFSFKAIYDNRNSLSISIATLILLSTMFNDSFNTIRQILASSILMLSVKPALEKKKIKFIVLV